MSLYTLGGDGGGAYERQQIVGGEHSILTSSDSELWPEESKWVWKEFEIAKNVPLPIPELCLYETVDSHMAISYYYI